MLSRSSLVVAVLGVCLAAWWADAAPNPGISQEVTAVFDKTTEIELYSLDPNPKEKAKDTFHDEAILGKTTVKDAEVRKKLLAAFCKGVDENKGKSAFCFEPRHGLRASHYSKIVDLVICFSCAHVHVYVDGKQTNAFLVAGSPQRVFDQILKDAKVPLPEK